MISTFSRVMPKPLMGYENVLLNMSIIGLKQPNNIKIIYPMQDKILYFQCNYWIPTLEEASKFIDHIGGDVFANEDNKYDIAAAKEWIKNNELCVNFDVYDMSCQYWVTCKESWLEMFFPELLPYANEVPVDDSIFGDGKFYLKYEERNFGMFSINEMRYNEDTDEKDRCVDIWYNRLEKCDDGKWRHRKDGGLTRYEKE